jgi:hypothetical protein
MILFAAWPVVVVAAFMLAYWPLPRLLALVVPGIFAALVILLVESQPPNDGGDSNKPIIAWMGATAIASVIAAAGAGAWSGRSLRH